MVTPRALRRAMISKRRWISGGVKVAVGSSRISTLLCVESALAISRSCIWATPSVSTRAEVRSRAPPGRAWLRVAEEASEVDDPGPPGQTLEEDVLCHRQVRQQV